MTTRSVNEAVFGYKMLDQRMQTVELKLREAYKKITLGLMGPTKMNELLETFKKLSAKLMELQKELAALEQEILKLEPEAEQI
jgi:hypothetical protein